MILDEGFLSLGRMARTPEDPCLSSEARPCWACDKVHIYGTPRAVAAYKGFNDCNQGLC